MLGHGDVRVTLSIYQHTTAQMHIEAGASDRSAARRNSVKLPLGVDDRSKCLPKSLDPIGRHLGCQFSDAQEERFCGRVADLAVVSFSHVVSPFRDNTVTSALARTVGGNRYMAVDLLK